MAPRSWTFAGSTSSVSFPKPAKTLSTDFSGPRADAARVDRQRLLVLQVRLRVGGVRAEAQHSLLYVHCEEARNSSPFLVETLAHLERTTN